ncbi:Coiled-coil and C2 domain-containing protein like [Argiope bruennichi]|uniref:Coiled-coil and C2 domain-containing protein like n=1 Tax=Argiope bruennichi TaxID=94029 RepID=A0A8T0EWR2_ARGBR|nr:Coiled-coil and C2 domain-containing protein like [Argiope bruennichi]
MASAQQESKIEITAEVVSEIPENIKAELRKRRKKLKEKKAKSSSIEESSFDMEEIKPEPYNDSQTRKDSVGKLPKVLPEILERPLPSLPTAFDNTTYRPDSLRNSEIIKESCQSSQNNSLPCEEEEISDYDFFTRVWDKTEETQQPEPCESSDIADGTSQDEADFVGLIRKELQEKLTGIEIVKHERASYIPFHIKIEKENNSFFHPSYKPVPVNIKLLDGKEPRYLEDEGFYVGKKPEVSKRNLNRLENRLVTQKEFQWFGDDGLVKMLPDPVCKSPVRHVVDEDVNGFPDLEYVKASLNSDKWRLHQKDDKGYQLDLDISSISFLHHPLFSSEHIIESRLLQMCEKHMCNEKRDVVNGLKQKLKGLRSAASNLKHNMQQGMQETAINNERQLRLKQYQKDIRQTKKLRDFHEAEQKSLWKSILDTWDELKQHRQTQGFTSTSLNLIIQEVKMDKAIEKEEWERELLDEWEKRNGGL